MTSRLPSKRMSELVLDSFSSRNLQLVAVLLNYWQCCRSPALHSHGNMSWHHGSIAPSAIGVETHMLWPQPHLLAKMVQPTRHLCDPFQWIGGQGPEPKNLPKSSPENGCCWLPGSIVGNGIASDHHRMQLCHEIQRPLPTSSLLACTYSGCVCDPIACKSFVQQVVQQQQSPLPLFTLLARTDCCTVCNDIGLNLSPQSDTLPRTTQRKRTKKNMFKLNSDELIIVHLSL